MAAKSLWAYFLLAACLGSSYPLFAQKNPASLKQDLAVSMSIDIQRNIKTTASYFDAFYTLKTKYGGLAAGLQFTPEDTNIFLKGLYTPLNTKHNLFGFFLFYHADWIHRMGTEQNISAGIEYTFRIPDNFSIQTSVGYLHKWQFVQVTGHKTIVIDNKNVLLSIQLLKSFKKTWFIKFGLASFDLFHYPLFFSPTWNLDAYYLSQGKFLPKDMFLGISFNLRYSDMLTLTAYPDKLIIKFLLGLEF